MVLPRLISKGIFPEFQTLTYLTKNLAILFKNIFYIIPSNPNYIKRYSNPLTSTKKSKINVHPLNNSNNKIKITTYKLQAFETTSMSSIKKLKKIQNLSELLISIA